jgi:hypothetical protein
MPDFLKELLLVIGGRSHREDKVSGEVDGER